MKENTTDKDAALKKLLADSKLKAGENLKYRIIQQIETESLFVKSAKKKERKLNARIKKWVTVLGVSYTCILCIVIGFFAHLGKSFYQLPEFYLSICFVGIISATFMLIFYVDEKREAE